MAKVIAIAGDKGGTGKTTLAHLIAHGAGSLPHPIEAVVITTDAGDEPVTGERRYLPADGRDLAALPAMLATLDQHDRLLIVIDGAAARGELDAIIGGVADLVLLPFGPSHQDLQRVTKDLSRLPDAVAVPNRWPVLPAQRTRAARWLEDIPDARRLSPVNHLPRVGDLLDPEAYRNVATPLSRQSQRLVLDILHRAGIHPLDLARR